MARRGSYSGSAIMARTRKVTSAGNLPDGEADAALIALTPGTYRLTRDFENPDADRRYTRDWRKLPVWKAGTIFRVDSELLHLVGGSWWSKYIRICNLPQGFVECLENVPETMQSFFDRLGVQHYDHFSKWMVRSGYMSREEFEKLWNVFQEEGK